jgi:hypothetical protein
MSSEGCAAHPVGYNSQMQIKMTMHLLAHFFFNFNLLDQVFGFLSRLKFNKVR